ncbi:hypothetical protein AAE478_003774 [Parahypoxylon ruwenzoriense]
MNIHARRGNRFKNSVAISRAAYRRKASFTVLRSAFLREANWNFKPAITKQIEGGSGKSMFGAVDRVVRVLHSMNRDYTNVIVRKEITRLPKKAQDELLKLLTEVDERFQYSPNDHPGYASVNDTEAITNNENSEPDASDSPDSSSN